KDWPQARVEAPRPDDCGFEPGDLARNNRVQTHFGLEPQTNDGASDRLPCIDRHLAMRGSTVSVLGADACLFNTDRPHASSAAEQGTQAVDGGKKVAAVLLHH